MTRWVVRPLRRLVQVLGVCLLVLLPLFSLYTHYRSARALEDLPRGQWRSAAMRAIDNAVGDNQRRQAMVEGTQGTFWSARVLGISLSDPLAGAEAIVSSRSFYRPMLWSLLIPVLATVLLGRFFCGWICPMNTLLELVDKCRGLLRLAELRERDVKFSLRNKYVMLAAGLGIVVVTGTPLLAMVYPPAVLSREMHQWIFGVGVGLGLYFILAICAIELFVSKRWWCRYVCPGGALYSLLGRFRVVRVRRDKVKCVDCGDCVRTCQFGLKPMLVETTGMECTNCASCIASCNSDALHYGIVLPFFPSSRLGKSGPAAATEQSDAASRVNGSAVRVTGLALAILLLWPASASAHHILGLPHYSYKENYPQAPTLEYPATTGPYDVLMTSYPGMPVPGEPATIAFYIKNRQTGLPCDKPVTVRVLQTFTFGANREILPSTARQPFDNQHKYTVTFPEDGEYVVELTMDVEGQTEVIRFAMVAGNPTATTSILVGLGIAFLLFVVTVRAIKKKRQRRRGTAATHSPERARTGAGR